MSSRYRLLLSVAALMLCNTISAQRTDSIYTYKKEYTRMFAVGATDILDTYLSPEKYRGTELRYLFQDNRRLHTHLAQTMIHQGSFGTVENRAKTGSELTGAYNFQYIMRYVWQLTPALEVAAGGGADLNLGFLYNTRNGNNPAQLHASLNISPAVALHYYFGGKWKFRLNYEAMAPAVGIMFSPEYGQSYYEILDDSKKDENLVFTTTASTPSFRQLLSIDIRPVKKWKRSWLRVGYLGDYQQAQVNHLKYHQYSHMFMMGYVKGM